MDSLNVQQQGPFSWCRGMPAYAATGLRPNLLTPPSIPSVRLILLAPPLIPSGCLGRHRRVLCGVSNVRGLGLGSQWLTLCMCVWFGSRSHSGSRGHISSCLSGSHQTGDAPGSNLSDCSIRLSPQREGGEGGLERVCGQGRGGQRALGHCFRGFPWAIPRCCQTPPFPHCN